MPSDQYIFEADSVILPGQSELHTKDSEPIETQKIVYLEEFRANILLFLHKGLPNVINIIVKIDSRSFFSSNLELQSLAKRSYNGNSYN